MSISREKMDHLILDYFIQEGHREAAISLAKELNIELEVPSSFVNTSQAKFNPFLNQLLTSSELSNQEISLIVDGYFNSNDGNDNVALPHDKKILDNSRINSTLISGYSTINQRKEIKLLILKGCITEAIKKISENFPTILDSNNLLHFKLLRLNLIEMIRNHKLSVNLQSLDTERQFLDEILTFVRENLINKVTNSFKLLKELEITMSLLCFNFDPNVKNIEDQKDLPEQLRSLFNLSLRNQCYRLVNKAILNLFTKDDSLNEDDGDAQDFNKMFIGPKFVEFDLSNIDKFDGGEMKTLVFDKADQDTEMGFSSQVNYSIDSGNQIATTSSVGDAEEGLPNEENLEEEWNKLQTLSLESKLERIIKLWTITEQRLLDFNIIPEKRYTFKEKAL